jgi:CBS domain-containing protein
MPENTGEMMKHLHELARKPVADFLEKEKRLLFCKPETPVPELLKLLEESKETSLPVIVVTRKGKKLVGLVSVWDVLEWIVFITLEKHNTDIE